MIHFKDSYRESQFTTLHLHIESKIKELPLYDFQIDDSSPGKEVAQAFQSNLLLPGIILTKQGEFSGIISQRQFLEIMSSPYGLELFSRRSICSLYRFVNQEIFKIPGELQIVEAARRSLQRLNHLVYEPIVVEIEPSVHRLLDMHQLLLADSQIHQLTCNLLHEKINEQTQELRQQIEKMASLSSPEPEKNKNFKDITSSITSEIKKPIYWNQSLNLLFIYCKSLRQVLSDYEALAAQEASGTSEISAESQRDLIYNKFPETLKTMHTDSTRLTKFIAGLQIFLNRILNSNNYS
ncbi:hypothetical protein H6F96_08665 [Microcoleus sp. FACHB-53]|nr:hypothetical protein [Microcoleus sp. FACHB-53]